MHIAGPQRNAPLDGDAQPLDGGRLGHHARNVLAIFFALLEREHGLFLKHVFLQHHLQDIGFAGERAGKLQAQALALLNQMKPGRSTRFIFQAHHHKLLALLLQGHQVVLFGLEQSDGWVVPVRQHARKGGHGHVIDQVPRRAQGLLRWLRHLACRRAHERQSRHWRWVAALGCKVCVHGRLGTRPRLGSSGTEMRGAPAGKGPLWGSLGVVPSISGSVSAAVHKAL